MTEMQRLENWLQALEDKTEKMGSSIRSSIKNQIVFRETFTAVWKEFLEINKRLDLQEEKDTLDFDQYNKKRKKP